MQSDEDAIIGARVREARVEAGYPVAREFARRIGVDAAVISRVENGKQSAGLALLRKISDATGRPIDWFVNGPSGQATGNEAA